MGDLAGVVLAAGAGSRLAPLTWLRPKALCPVGGVPLVDRAIDRLVAQIGPGGADRVAVNAHHHARQLTDHLDGRAHLSVEAPVALGTAGALGALRPWLDGRDVLVTNADAYLPDGLTPVPDGLTPVPDGLAPAGGEGFTAGWDGERCRLACIRSGTGACDFRLPDGTGVRYVGAALLPWRLVRDLAPIPSGLYEVLWREAESRGALDLRLLASTAIDCGTVADYLRANLHASGGRSVIGDGAVVAGRLTRSVVWDGARVEAGEHLVDVVRAGGGGTTVTVGARAATE